MTGAVQIRSMTARTAAPAAASARPRIGKVTSCPLAPAVRVRNLSQAPRLCVARVAEPNSSSTEPENFPALQEQAGPLGGVMQLGKVALKLVMDAWNLLQRLVELVQRVRVAAAAIQASAESRMSAPASTQSSLSPAPSASSSSGAAPLQLLAVGAVTHLRHTLTDATGTLEAKWRALESTASERMGGLFNATQDSAVALNKLQASSGEAAPRLWSQQSTAAVVQEEEALRRQVFAQVYAELNAQAKRSDGNSPGYCPA